VVGCRRGSELRVGGGGGRRGGGWEGGGGGGGGRVGGWGYWRGGAMVVNQPFI